MGVEGMHRDKAKLLVCEHPEFTYTSRQAVAHLYWLSQYLSIIYQERKMAKEQKSIKAEKKKPLLNPKEKKAAKKTKKEAKDGLMGAKMS